MCYINVWPRVNGPPSHEEGDSVGLSHPTREGEVKLKVRPCSSVDRARDS